MALRFVARRVGIPAFRQGSVPRLSPSAGSRPLASRSSQSGYSNWTEADAAHKKRRAEYELKEYELKVEKEIEEEVAKIKASFKEARENIKNARKMEMREWRIRVDSGAAGFALAVYTFSCFARKLNEPFSWIESRLKGTANDGLVMTASEFSDIACYFAYTVNTILYLSNGSCDEDALMEKLRLIGLSCREFNTDMLEFLTRKGYLKREIVVETGRMYNSRRVILSATLSSLQACTTGKMKNQIAEAVVRKGTLREMMA